MAELADSIITSMTEDQRREFFPSLMAITAHQKVIEVEVDNIEN
jgi:hypothetical protein